MIRNNPSKITSQKILPLNTTHAECKKFKSFPNNVHWYADEIHAIKIAPRRRTNPTKSSSHLFIVFLFIVFSLKRFRL